MDKRQNGVIRLSWRLAQHLLPEVKIDDTTTQGYLRECGIFDQLHKRLLFPESYVICGIYFEWMRQCWNILVYSPEITEPKEGLYLPHVEPIYTCDMHGNNRKLVRMHIEYEQPNDRVLRID